MKSSKCYSIFCVQDRQRYYDVSYHGVYEDRRSAYEALVGHAEETLDELLTMNPGQLFCRETERFLNVEAQVESVIIHVFSKPVHDEYEFSVMWKMLGRAGNNHSAETLMSI